MSLRRLKEEDERIEDDMPDPLYFIMFLNFLLSVPNLAKTDRWILLPLVIQVSENHLKPV